MTPLFDEESITAKNTPYEGVGENNFSDVVYEAVICEESIFSARNYESN